MHSLLAVVLATSMMLVQTSLPAQSPRTTVDRAVKAYSKIRTIRATFIQTVTNPLTGSDVASRGVMQQQIPGRLSVHFTDPAGDRIVADGKVVWLYLPSTNPGQVIKTAVGQNAANVPDVTSWFLDSPETRYRMSNAGTATIAGHATHAVALVSRDPTIPFARATVWVDDDDAIIRQFETTGANGLTRRITITGITPNAKLDPGAFTFTPPRGVRVVQQ
ncbi:MAG TPA: outer membrane lipoprotein carrier protein LolA [Gemmatimonadaceae bacterium]